MEARSVHPQIDDARAGNKAPSDDVPVPNADLSIGVEPAQTSGFKETWSRPLFARLRWQFPLVVLSCAVLPAIVIAAWKSASLLPAWHVNTFVATLVCSTLALFLFRRLEDFPGITSLAHVLPSVLAPYGGAVSAIIALRLDYSRPLLVSSALGSIVLFTGLWAYHRRRCTPTVYVVPGAELTRTPRLKLHELTEPAGKLERYSIVAADLRATMTPEWERFILRSALAGIPVFHAKALQESITGKVEIEHLSENTFGSVIPSLAYLRVKRIIDILLAIAVMPLFLPLVAMVAIAIKLDSRGAVFFYQDRTGFRGEVFVMMKFRTMRERDITDSGDNLQLVMTQANDARITRMGRLLRRSRLDELPQIFNVLKGQMSWIGPRPEAVLLSHWYNMQIPFYGYRHMVRPGITGWAQVNQGHVVDVNDVREKLYFDFYYIKHFSAWLDLLIALRTIRTMIKGSGAR